jgi:hypothetical protein
MQIIATPNVAAEQRRARVSLGDALGSPGPDDVPLSWGILVAALGALAAAILFTWPVWPGFMSFDSVFAYTESVQGLTTAGLPPMQPYLFFVFRTLGLGLGGVLFFQAFVLFFGSALILRFFVRSTWPFVAAFAAYAGLYLYFPTMAGTVFVHWKDVPTAGFCVLGIGLWLIAEERRSYWLLFAGILSICVAVAARLNGITLVLPLLAVLVAYPFGARSTARSRIAAAACLLAGLMIVYASMTWRLPDLKPFPKDRGMAILMFYDLIGVSACSGQDFLPPNLGHSMTGEQVRRHYDPRSLDLSYVPKFDTPNIEQLNLNSDESEAVVGDWKRVIPSHVGCFAAHRGAVFEELVGLDTEGVWYPTNAGISANPYGFHLEHMSAGADAAAFVVNGANMLWRRAFILFIIAPIVALIAWLVVGSRLLLLPVMTLGAFCYLAGLAVLAPAADARYVFPPSVLCAVVIIVGIAALAERYLRQRRALGVHPGGDGRHG